jgi:hypothetical protein
VKNMYLHTQQPKTKTKIVRTHQAAYFSFPFTFYYSSILFLFFLFTSFVLVHLLHCPRSPDVAEFDGVCVCVCWPRSKPLSEYFSCLFLYLFNLICFLYRAYKAAEFDGAKVGALVRISHTSVPADASLYLPQEGLYRILTFSAIFRIYIYVCIYIYIYIYMNIYI